MNILLVEDSTFLRVSIAKVLAKAGHDVVGVADGRRALQAARSAPPDVILLDMMLPGLDGMAVMKELRESPSTAQIPIVVLTGLAQKNESRLKKAGAAAYIEKASLDLHNSAGPLLSTIERVTAKTSPRLPASAQPDPLLPIATADASPATSLVDGKTIGLGRSL